VGEGEAFEARAGGHGLHLFVGVPFVIVDEFRIGVALNSHADDLSRSRATVRSVYIETYWAKGGRLLRVRVAPRLAWLQQRRSFYTTKPTDYGFGGNIATQLRMRRASLESGLALTGITFPSPAEPDPDRIAPGWIWEFRVGIAYRIK
jgi:hypothetical protein